MTILLLSYGAVANPLLGHIKFTDTPPTIDGELDAVWDSAVEYTMEEKFFADFSSDDFSGTWKGLWDSDNLYIMVEINNALDLVTELQDNWWEDDVVEIYIDGNNSRTGDYGDFDYQFGFRYNDPTVNMGTGVEEHHVVGIQHAYIETASGYNMEIAIPWSSLGVADLIKAGHVLGFDVQPVWGEGLGKLSWNADEPNAWYNTHLFGTIILEPESGVVGHVNYTSTMPTIDGTVDPVWDDAVEYPIENKLFADFSFDDFSATWKGLWDYNYLYLMVEINNTAELVTDLQEHWWEDDVVEVYIDGDNAKETSYRDALDYQFGFRYNDPDVNMGTGVLEHNIVGVEHAYIETTNGYNMEIAIPWTALEISHLIQVGHVLGFDVQPVWGTETGKLLWHDVLGQAWNNPSLMGVAYLAGNEDVPPAPEKLLHLDISASEITWNAEEDHVEEVKDISGKDNHAVRSRDYAEDEKQRINYSPSGLPMLWFERHELTVDFDQPEEQPNTIFVMFDAQGDWTQHVLGKDGEDNYKLQIAEGSDGDLSIHSGAGALSTTFERPSELTLATGLFNGANSAMRVNGVEVASGSLGTLALNELIIGGGRQWRLMGNIAEIIVYNGILSPAEVAEIESQLLEKWTKEDTPDKIFHLDASVLDLGNGAEVTEWTDMSGNDNHATASGLGSQPVFATNASPTGLSSVSFNKDPLPITFTETKEMPITAFYVFAAEPPIGDTEDMVLTREVGGNGFRVTLTGNSAEWAMNVWSGGGWPGDVVYAPFPRETYAFHQATVVFNANDTYLRVNGEEKARGAIDNVVLSSLNIGINFRGMISEIIFYEGELDEATIAAIEADLAEKWIGEGTLPVILPEVVYEPFDYTADEALLDQGAAGNGWAGPWEWQGGNEDTGSNLVQEGSLELSGFASAGNKVFLHNNRLIRELEHTWPDEEGREYWISFMWQRVDDDETQDGGSYGGIALFMDNQELISMGKPWSLNTHGLHGEDPSGSDVPTETLARLVVKVVMNGTEDPADVYAWVNPDPEVEPDTTTAHASTKTNVSGGFNKIRVAAGNDGLQALVDEIYISESYDKIYTPYVGPIVLPELVYESFEYPVGEELLGLGEAENGWGGPWNWQGGDADGGTNVIEAGSLQVQNFGSEGNKVFLHNHRLLRNLDQTWPDEEGRVYWISFMWQRTDDYDNLDGGSYGGIALFKDGQELFSAGKPWFDNYHGLHGADDIWDASDIPTQELVRLVVKVEMNGTDDPDPIYAWVNPDPNVEPDVATADAVSIARNFGGFNQIRVATGNNETTVLIDEIFLSESYEKIFRSAEVDLYALNLEVDPTDAGTVTGAGNYEEDEEVQLTATANQGFVFVNWTNAADEVVSTDASFTYTMPAADVTLTANFDLENLVKETMSLVRVYPNPAGDFLFVENLSGNNSIRISNIVGQQVRQVDTHDSLFELNISDLESGVYLIQITNESGMKKVEKFLKK